MLCSLATSVKDFLTCPVCVHMHRGHGSLWAASRARHIDKGHQGQPLSLGPWQQCAVVMVVVVQRASHSSQTPSPSCSEPSTLNKPYPLPSLHGHDDATSISFFTHTQTHVRGLLFPYTIWHRVGFTVYITSGFRMIPNYKKIRC